MVGISFAYRHDVFDHERHSIPNTAEDFDMLRRLCYARLKCVISPYLTYFVHGKNGNLSVMQGKRVIIPSKASPLATMMDWELRLGKAKCFKEKIDPQHIPFVFTEKDDLFFGKNVLALQAKLERAARKGCEGAKAAREKIDVMFRHDTPPVRKKYIQIQLEQHSSTTMNKKYREKLKNAHQIWEMTTGSARD